MKTLKDILPSISDWDDKDIINERHIPFGVKNKEGKTLHNYELWEGADCGDGWNGEYSSLVVRYHLQEIAKEWIKHLEEEYMYWLDKFNIYQPALIFGIDEKTKKRKKDEEFKKNQIEKSLQSIGGQIWWIKMFFNLDVKNEEKRE